MNHKLKFPILEKFPVQADFAKRIGISETISSRIIRKRRQAPSELKRYMDVGELKIIKGKNWAQPGHNPNGKVFKFKLEDGCRFLEG